MIFALVDYLRYRFQRGPYSPRKLEEGGWFLADKSSLNMLKAARNGDVLFSQPVNSFTSWVVMYFQGGPCSHVGMLTNEGTVIEAIAIGVIERTAFFIILAKLVISGGPLASANLGWVTKRRIQDRASQWRRQGQFTVIQLDR